MLDLDYRTIAQSDEYQEDFTTLVELIVDGIAFEHMVHDKTPWVYVLAHIGAFQRYFIRHLPDLHDIDETPFIDLIQQEVGFDLPSLSAVPIVEFLREVKYWNGYKGTEVPFHFAGALIGSPISLWYPESLIFELSNPNTCLSGATGVGGELPPGQSKLGRIRDGVFWAKFVYVVNVEQAQNVTDWGDLTAIMDSVHPAHTKRFIQLSYNWLPENSASVPTILYRKVVVSRFWMPTYSWPTISNNWIISGPAKFDQRSGDYSLRNLYIRRVPSLREASLLFSLPLDTLTHAYPAGKPWIAFSRMVTNGDGTTYSEVFSDQDSLVLNNVQTNVGLRIYEYSILENLTYRHLQNAAYDLDQANMYGQAWLDQGLHVQITP